MTVPPLKGPHIQATGYRRGRTRAHTANPPVWLALHTTEGIQDEIALGKFWQGRAASSNAGIGRDGGYATYVHYEDTAWTNPPVHDDTETLEICGMAGWTRTQWLGFPKMLETIAHWIAWRTEVLDIPIVRREGKDIANFRPGVVDHDGINDVFHDSSHWDVGENFPWDKVLTRAKTIRYQGDDDMPLTNDDLNKIAARVEALLTKERGEYHTGASIEIADPGAHRYSLATLSAVQELAEKVDHIHDAVVPPAPPA